MFTDRLQGQCASQMCNISTVALWAQSIDCLQEIDENTMQHPSGAAAPCMAAGDGIAAIVQSGSGGEARTLLWPGQRPLHVHCASPAACQVTIDQYGQYHHGMQYTCKYNTFCSGQACSKYVASKHALCYDSIQVTSASGLQLLAACCCDYAFSAGVLVLERMTCIITCTSHEPCSSDKVQSLLGQPILVEPPSMAATSTHYNNILGNDSWLT